MTEPDLLENDPTRVLMRQIFGAIAQYEKAMIVEKLRAARQRVKAKRGRCEGRKPYGETDAEKAVIERTQQMRARGMSYCAIAGALTAGGVPAPPRAAVAHNAGRGPECRKCRVPTSYAAELGI